MIAVKLLLAFISFICAYGYGMSPEGDRMGAVLAYAGLAIVFAVAIV